MPTDIWHQRLEAIPARAVSAPRQAHYLCEQAAELQRLRLDGDHRSEAACAMLREAIALSPASAATIASTLPSCKTSSVDIQADCAANHASDASAIPRLSRHALAGRSVWPRNIALGYWRNRTCAGDAIAENQLCRNAARSMSLKRSSSSRPQILRRFRSAHDWYEKHLEKRGVADGRSK